VRNSEITPATNTVSAATCRQKNPASSNYRQWGALLLVPAAFGILALLLGQDANWDLRNYHFYNAYAFLRDRLGYDVAPAQVATYYNPLLFVPFYFAVTSLPPMVVGFLLGLLQGMNFLLLVLIGRELIPPTAGDPARRLWLAALLGLLGMLGAGNISELGTTFSDNIVSLLILGSL